MRICVIGAGAMGSTFGELLARAGHDVTFVDTWREHVVPLRARLARLPQPSLAMNRLPGK